MLVETSILKKLFASLNIDDDQYITNLANWADGIRKTFYDGGIDEVISTRRLVHITKTYAIFEDRLEAIELATARFDDETKAAFIDLYTKIDEETSVSTLIEEAQATENPVVVEEMDHTPF